VLARTAVEALTVLDLAMAQRVWLAGLLTLASCFADNGKVAQPPHQPPPKDPTPHGKDYSATIADPLGFLPADSEIVFGLDVDSVRRSTLGPPLAARLAELGGTELTLFKQTCGFDPMTTVHAITLGIKNVKQATPDGVIVVHGLDRPQLTNCMSRAQSRDPKVVTIQNGIVEINNRDPNKPDGSKVVFAFVDASTVVGVIGPTANRDRLQTVLASGVPLRSSLSFVELIKLTDLESSLWGVINGASSVFDQVAGLGMRPKAVFGSLTLANGMSIAMRLRLESPAQATQLQQLANGQVGMARSMFEKLDITTDNADVVVAAAMNDQQLTAILSLAGVSLGP